MPDLAHGAGGSGSRLPFSCAVRFWKLCHMFNCSEYTDNPDIVRPQPERLAAAGSSGGTDRRSGVLTRAYSGSSPRAFLVHGARECYEPPSEALAAMGLVTTTSATTLGTQPL